MASVMDSDISLDAKKALASAQLGELKKKANAGTWNTHMEMLIKSWGEKAAGLRYLHDSAAGRWRGFSNRLSLASIVIGVLSSGVSLVSTSIEEKNAKNAVLYAVGAVGLVSTFLQSLKKFYNSEEKAADHNAVARQFGSFYRYIVLQMSLSREDRLPSDQLSEWVNKEYERMQQEARPLGGKDIKKFKAHFANSMQSLPDVCESEHIILVEGKDLTEFSQRSRSQSQIQVQVAQSS